MSVRVSSNKYSLSPPIYPHRKFFMHCPKCIPDLSITINSDQTNLVPIYLSVSSSFYPQYKILHTHPSKSEHTNIKNKLYPNSRSTLTDYLFWPCPYPNLPLIYQVKYDPRSGINISIPLSPSKPDSQPKSAHRSSSCISLSSSNNILSLFSNNTPRNYCGSSTELSTHSLSQKNINAYAANIPFQPSPLTPLIDCNISPASFKTNIESPPNLESPKTSHKLPDIQRQPKIENYILTDSLPNLFTSPLIHIPIIFHPWKTIISPPPMNVHNLLTRKPLPLTAYLLSHTKSLLLPPSILTLLIPNG